VKVVLITGGGGDLAKDFKLNFNDKFKILTPSSNELDVSSELSIKKYIEGKQIDILINNAGVIHPKRILESDSELWIKDINVNLIGTYLCSKLVLSKNKYCKIINISSTAAFNHYPDWSSYCISKIGVVSLTKCLANDKFEAYCLCPGAIDTKFRNNFSLSNANVIKSKVVSEHIFDIISDKYNSGDILYFRKNEFKLNP
jgi:3-oxoacyl-[acyl-carrier protein] reductase